MRSLQAWRPALLLVVALAACETDTEIETTIPRDGQEGVDPRTVIAVRLDDIMTAADEGNTDLDKIVVTGDQTPEAYAGTIERARHSQLFNGQTVEQFRSGQTSPGQEPAPQSEEPDGETSEPQEDTLVFLLDGGVRFKPGERVTVRVSENVTTRGKPLAKTRRFRFVVTTSDEAAGELRVTSTEPDPEAAAAGVDPDLRAAFSESVRAESLSGAVSVRGLQSGVHGDLRALLPSGATTVSEATVKLDFADRFLPGEEVHVTGKSDIAAPAAAGEEGAISLRPHVLRFQVRPGRTRDWQRPLVLPGVVGSAVAVLAADFLPALPDFPTAGAVTVRTSEFALVLPDRLRLYRLTRPGEWAQVAAVRFEGRRVCRAAAADDTDADGVPEVVVVLQDERGERDSVIRQYAVSAEGELEEKGGGTEFPARAIDTAALGDLDGDGQLELVVTHERRVFVTEGDIAGDTGTVTFFQLRQGPPPGAEIELDPEALLAFNYAPLEAAVVDFPRTRRLAVRDLDGDGRPDLAAESGEGLVLYRNQHSPQNPMSFRRTGVLPGLPGRGGEVLSPQGWLALDTDGDHDVDILAWDREGGLLYENCQRGGSDRCRGSAGLLFDETRPQAFDLGFTPGEHDLLLAANTDGDARGTVDLVAGRESGQIRLLLGTPEPLAFEELRFAGAGAPSAMAVADVDGDTGMDLVAVAAGQVQILASRGTDVASGLETARFVLSCARPDCTGEEGGVRRIRVTGTIPASFSGYSLALDFDEDLLQLERFEPPGKTFDPSLLAVSSCATAAPCPGIASVTVSFARDVVYERAVDVDLGSFLFRTTSVVEPTPTRLELLAEPQGNHRNAVTAVESGGGSQVIPVRDLGKPLEFTVEPPLPEELAVGCEFLEQLAAGYRARITWESPRGTPFTWVRIQVGEVTFVEEWSRTLGDGLTKGIELTDTQPGRVPVEFLAAVDPEDARDPPDDLPEAWKSACGFVSVHQPRITSCEGHLVQWVQDHEVDGFKVYKRDRFGTRQVADLESDVQSWLDPSPSATGRDTYLVSAVISGLESLRATCQGGDPVPCRTEDPVPRSARLATRTRPSEPNVLRMTWTNGEAYDRLLAFLSFTPLGSTTPQELFPAAGLELEDPTGVQFFFTGDADRGGARPGEYTLRLKAANIKPAVAEDPCPEVPAGEEVESNEVTFPSVTVPLPEPAGLRFRPGPSGSRDLVVAWDPLWRGYDSVELTVEHTAGGTTTPLGPFPDLLGGDSEYLLREVDPIGSYQAVLAVRLGSETRTATASFQFSPAVVAGDVSVGLGLDSFEIPLEARGVARNVTGFDLELDLPAFVTVDGVAFPAPEFAAVEEVPGAARGRRRVRVRADGVDLVPAAGGGDDGAGGHALLLTLAARSSGTAPEAGREEELRLSGSGGSGGPRLQFQGSATFHSVEPQNGRLRFHSRYVVLDTVEAGAGQSDPVRVAARLTFHGPPGREDYAFNGFALRVLFDRENLELLPVTTQDQSRTAIAGKGLYLLGVPLEGESLTLVNQTGILTVVWFASRSSLEPVTNEEILVLRFRLRGLPGPEDRFAPISFLTTGENPTQFFPEPPAVIGFLGVEGFIPGGVQIRGLREALVLEGLEPARGPLPGGGQVVLRGRGFPVDPGAPLDLRLLPAGGGVPVPVDPASLERLSSGEVRFAVPDPGLALASGSALYDLEVETARGVARLEKAYRFDAPGVAGADVATVRSPGGDIVRIQGQGFTAATRAAFMVGPRGFPAAVLRRSPDGTALVLESPEMPEMECQQAALRLELPELGTALTLSQTFRVLPASGLGSDCSGEPPPPPPPPPEVQFQRGDADASGGLRNLSDAVFILRFAFGRGAEPSCVKAADADDSGTLNLTDGVFLLNFLFRQGDEPPEPFTACGTDPTADALGCERYEPCE